MIVLFLILVLLILLCVVRMSNNEDLVVENCKDESDLANINNAKKIFRKTKVYNYLLIAFYVLTIVLIICAFTDIDVKIIDFLSTELINEEDYVFNFSYFFAPIYLITIREILIQVKIGEFLLKYFEAEEPVLEENILKTLLYKKPKQVSKNFNNEIPINNSEQFTQSDDEQ